VAPTVIKEETILTCIFAPSFLDLKDLPDFSFFHHPLDQITHGLEPLGSETKTESFFEVGFRKGTFGLDLEKTF
jgi:hypothetical protein